MKKIINKNWSIITFLILTIILILLNKDIIFKAYLHAEDGWFLNDAMDKGIGSLFMKNGGYFIVLSRISSIIAVLFGRMFSSIIVSANILKFISIIICAFSINYLNTKEFEWLIKNKYVRLLLSVSLMTVMTNFAWMAYNCVAIHWWGGTLIFLISLNLINNRLPSYWIIPFAILCILSSASVMPLGLAIVYYLYKQINFKKSVKENLKSFKKEQIYKLLLLFLPLVIQALSILTNNSNINSTVSSLSFTYIIQLISKIFGIILVNPVYIFGVSTFKILYNLNLIKVVSMILWCVILYLSLKIKKTKDLICAVIYIFAIYFMISFKFPNALSFDWSESYYYSLPVFIICFEFFVLLFKNFKKNNIYLYFLILIFFCYTNYENRYPIDFVANDSLQKIDKYVDFESNKYINVEISPNHEWQIKVPINDEFCEEYGCEKSV